MPFPAAPPCFKRHWLGRRGEWGRETEARGSGNCWQTSAWGSVCPSQKEARLQGMLLRPVAFPCTMSIGCRKVQSSHSLGGQCNVMRTALRLFSNEAERCDFPDSPALSWRILVWKSYSLRRFPSGERSPRLKMAAFRKCDLDNQNAFVRKKGKKHE